MFFKLLGFEINYYLRQIVFWVAIAYALLAGSLLLTNTYQTVYYSNSSFSVVEGILKFSTMVSIFMTGFLAASTILRDSENQFESIIYATPIDKFQYLVVKFLGLFTMVFVVHGVAVITMVISTLTMEPELLGPLRVFDYVYAITVILFPNILLCTSIIFTTAMLFKKMMPIYIVTLMVFVVYVVASMLGNSPLMAMSTPFTQEGGGISSLLDPYGVISFFEQTAFWSVDEKNVLLPQLKGSFLYNRLIWLTVAISLFVHTYSRFTFKLKNKSRSKGKEDSIDPVLVNNYAPKPVVKVGKSFYLKILLSKLKIEYLSVVKGLPFIIVITLILSLNLINIFEQIFRGPLDQTAYYPLTQLILEILQDPLSKAGSLVAIFYAVELYWNERSFKMEMIVDSTPVRNSIFYLSKLLTLSMICFTLIFSSCLAAILFQFALGHFDVKPLLYARLFYYSGSLLILVGGFTLILQRFAPNKAVGLAFGAAIVFYPLLLKKIGITHPLTLFAYNPPFIFSDMANSIYHEKAYGWLNVYWSAFVGFLSILAIVFWKRGSSQRPEKGSIILKVSAVGFLLVFFASGGYNFYQFNILNDRKSEDERIAYRAYYEKTYSPYKDLVQPTITHINVNVDVFPEERRYVAEGSFTFQNKSEIPIERLMISVQKVDRLDFWVKLNDATLESVNEEDQVLWFNLNKPLQPQENSELSYFIDITRTAFSQLDGENYVTHGGSYFELEDYLPFFGYLDTYELNNKSNREKYGLSESSYPDPKGLEPAYIDDSIFFSSRISTSVDQTAVTVGNLEKEEIINGRRYFYYKTDQKIERVFPITSAAFTIVKKPYKGVDMQVFHAPTHSKDNVRLFEALKSGLDYFQENFGPYTFKNFKIVELPYFSSEQSFGAAFPGMYGGVENRFFNLNHEGSFRNELLRGVIHEFSHQYWGMYIQPMVVAGFPMLTEVLAKYSELVLQEKLYGKYSNNAELNQALDIYLRNRTRTSNAEKPLTTLDFNPMVYYPKGLHSMTALRALIGEEKVNQALRNLLEKYRSPIRPTSLHLLDEFFAVSAPSTHKIITDLFARVVFHDFKLESAEIEPHDQEFKTTIQVTALKYVLDEKTNKEYMETLDDHIEIAFYSGFPEVENQNMTFIESVKFDKEKSTVTLFSKEKPIYIKIDPNSYRIDRSTEDNILKVE